MYPIIYVLGWADKFRQMKHVLQKPMLRDHITELLGLETTSEVHSTTQFWCATRDLIKDENLKNRTTICADSVPLYIVGMDFGSCVDEITRL